MAELPITWRRPETVDFRTHVHRRSSSTAGSPNYGCSTATKATASLPVFIRRNSMVPVVISQTASGFSGSQLINSVTCNVEFTDTEGSVIAGLSSIGDLDTTRASVERLFIDLCASKFTFCSVISLFSQGFRWSPWQFAWRDLNRPSDFAMHRRPLTRNRAAMNRVIACLSKKIPSGERHASPGCRQRCQVSAGGISGNSDACDGLIVGCARSRPYLLYGFV